MGLWLHGMNKVRELDRFLYEENGEIIPDNIPISFLSVKLGGKAAHVSNGVLKAGGIIEWVQEQFDKAERTALPRDPWTVLKRTNTGVLRDGSVKTGA